MRTATATRPVPTGLEVYLRKSLKLLPADGRTNHVTKAVVATFNHNLTALGFTCSVPLLDNLRRLNGDELAILYRRMKPVLRHMTGAHQTFEPMYPNFPRQVMEASEAELYYNAIMHYTAAAIRDEAQGQPRLAGGKLMEGSSAEPTEIHAEMRWIPNYNKERRATLPEVDITLRVIRLGSTDDFLSLFTQLAAANVALSPADKEVVEWFVDNRRTTLPKLLPEVIPNKENLAHLLGTWLKHEVPDCLVARVKTATDVLRLAVVMSKGDVSLAENTKFRRFKRPERRFRLAALERAPSVTEDMLRRPEVWKRLGRELRPGDYWDRFPKTLKAFTVIRRDEPYTTFNSSIEAALRTDVDEAVKLLSERPGDFARRLDHVLRLADGHRSVLKAFEKVVSKVATPVLLQARAHFLRRDEPAARTFFPKGSTAKVQVKDEPLPPLKKGISAIAAETIRDALVCRFKTLPKLGKVYVCPSLQKQLVPFAQRSASKALRTLVRSSRLPLVCGGVLRFFIWWKEPEGQRTDVDLSAVAFADGWTGRTECAYYNLRDGGMVHSGDITSAPNGACEFIDVDIEQVLARGLRYLLPTIYSYTQQAFKDMPECFTGWMSRSEMGKPRDRLDRSAMAQGGAIFDARTVQDKIDLAGSTTVNIPMVIDLVEREVIWADLALNNRNAINNAQTTGFSLAKVGKAITSLHDRPTLYDLFDMHREARGSVSKTTQKADTVFSMHEGITPFDTAKIMSEYMA